MSCQHREDVCQHCLEKVQTTTDPPQQKKEDSQPKKTLGQKTISLLVDSSIFAAAGALLYANNKLFKTAAANLFDSILGVIGWRTE